MPRKNAAPAVARQYVTGPDLTHRFAIPPGVLRKLRMLGQGPEFVKVGHRTIVYDLQKFEAWLAQLPRGGGRSTK